MNSSAASTQAPWSWISIPDHQGVVHVGGRIGAAQGPEATWILFQKLKGRSPVHQRLSGPFTVSPITPNIEKNHAASALLIQEQSEQSLFTVVFGGGHDLVFPQLLGIQKALSKKLGRTARVGCINLDAHLDVRKPSPLITSGSPFYLALDSGVLQPDDFIEFGIQSHCNAPDLWDYIDTKKVKVIPFSEVRDPQKAREKFEDALSHLASTCDGIVISLDLDCIEQAAAPGVSAPQAEGFRPSDIIDWIELAAKNSKVCSLGIFELNPVFDRDSQTARIAATAAWHFAESKLTP